MRVDATHLFNIGLLLEAVMRETLDGYTGLRIEGRIVTSVRYADDIVLIATSQSDLQELVNQLDRASRKYRLEIKYGQDKDLINLLIDMVIRIFRPTVCCTTVMFS